MEDWEGIGWASLDGSGSLIGVSLSGQGSYMINASASDGFGVIGCNLTGNGVRIAGSLLRRDRWDQPSREWRDGNATFGRQYLWAMLHQQLAGNGCTGILWRCNDINRGCDRQSPARLIGRLYGRSCIWQFLPEPSLASLARRQAQVMFRCLY